MNVTTMDTKDLWQTIISEAQSLAAAEPLLTQYLTKSIIEQPSLDTALSAHLANLLSNPFLSEQELQEIINQAFTDNTHIILAASRDIIAYKERDAACEQYVMPYLYFKGFHALQAYRVAHQLHQQDRKSLALFFQNLISQTFGVDIHPAAQIGAGIMIDHATGVVIGETAVIEDNVSMLHSVTLGGTGTDCHKDRHPKIRQGVLLSAGAKILGNVEVGEGSKVAAGSLVLEDVPPHTTVAGVPAKVVGVPSVDQPALAMNQDLSNDK